MKKILITIFSLFCVILFIPNWVSSEAKTTHDPVVMGGCDAIDFQYGTNLIDCDNKTEEGMGANLIDTSNIKVDHEQNILYYDAWLIVNDFAKYTYYFTIDGIKPNGQDLYVLFADEEDAGSDFGDFACWQVAMVSDSVCIYGIPGDYDYHIDNVQYITFVIEGGDYIFDKEGDYYKDKVYLNRSTLMPNYYTPYFYDPLCLSYNETIKDGIVENDFITSTSKKVNVGNLANAIKCSDSYTVELVSDEYSQNYNKSGNYTITFNVTKDNKTEIVKFVATVISLGSITYNGTLDASYTYNLSTNIGALEFIENLPSEIVNDFTFDLSSGLVKKRFVFDDADITGDGVVDKIENFQEICKVPGIYKARWELYSNIDGEAIEDSYEVTITIIDDSKIEVFVPKFVIYLNPEKTYTSKELAKQIKNLLVINNIFDETATVTITSNEYEANSNSEGEYKVTYRVIDENHIYDESCYVNVSINNSYEPEIKIIETKGFNTSIVYISITVALVLGVATYFTIKVLKNRKKH